MSAGNESDFPPTSSLNANTRLRIAPNVVSAEVGDDMALLDPMSGMYYSLNAVGARLWTLASDGATVGSIVDTLVVEFEVERDVLWRDLSAVIENLRQKALLEVLPGTE